MDIPSPCTSLADQVAALANELAILEAELAKLLATVPPPVDLAARVADLNNRIAAKKAEADAAQRALTQCLRDNGVDPCAVYRALARRLDQQIRFHQREITRRVDEDHPRRKDVIMRDIRTAQAERALIKAAMRLLGC